MMLPKWIPRPAANGTYELSLKDVEAYNLDTALGSHLFINGHEYEVVGKANNKLAFLLKEGKIICKQITPYDIRCP